MKKFWKGDYQFMRGQSVRIEGRITWLDKPLDIPGGWIVNPPVHGFRYWNEDEMVPYERRSRLSVGGWPI